MSVRQRLRATLDARWAQQRCWRCAFQSPRYSSATLQPDSQHPRKDTFDLVEPMNERDWTQNIHQEHETPKGRIPRKIYSKQKTSSLDPLIRTYESRSTFNKAVHILKDGRLVLSEHPELPSPRAKDEIPDPLPRVIHDNRPTKVDSQNQFDAEESSRVIFDNDPITSLSHRGDDPPLRLYYSDKGLAPRGPRINLHKSNKGLRCYEDLQILRQLNEKDIEQGIVDFQEPSTYDIEYSVVGDSKLSQVRKRIQILKQCRLSPIQGTSMNDSSRLTISKYAPGPLIRYCNHHPAASNESRLIDEQEDPDTEFITYTAQSEADTYLLRTTGPPLGTDEVFQEELESVLDAFINLQTSSSGAGYSSSTSMPNLQHCDHFDGQPNHRSKANTDNGDLKTFRRRYSLNSLVCSSRSYVTVAAQPSQDISRVDPSVTYSKPNHNFTLNGGNIREHLKLWQEEHSIKAEPIGALAPPQGSTPITSQNLYTQSGEDDSFTVISRDDETEEDSDVDLQSDDAIPNIVENHLFLRRGDLVELMAGNQPILAIFVRHLIDQCQFYTMRGEWVNRAMSTARFAVPGFVHPEKLGDILPYLPAEEVEPSRMNKLQPMDVTAPRDAGAKVIEEMWRFHQAADHVFRSNADRINRAYELIAPPNKSEGRTHRSLHQIAMIVLQKDNPSELTQSMLWAVHRALMPSQNITFDRINNRLNPVYEIHPQQSVSEFAQIQRWVREYQEGLIEEAADSFSIDSASTTATRSLNPMFTFVKKARIAIEQSRQTRPLSVNGVIGPSSVKIEPVEPDFKMFNAIPRQSFDDKEKIIVRYLDAWVASEYINQHTHLSSLGPAILRATGKYDGFELKEDIGFTFLQELGIVTPWENRIVYTIRGLRLPGHDTVSEESTRLRQKAYNWVHDSAVSLEHKLKDSMGNSRMDWGDLPVFCIDRAETLERDDGVSLQPVDGNSSEYWVHVHVANPSAFITPGSPVGQYAAQLFESVYFPERKYPMLSPALTSNRFSLANDRPCLTFSARISTGGDVLERKIIPGIVRNVKYLTTRSVGLGLGLNEATVTESVPLLTVGGEFPFKPEDHNPMSGGALSESHIEILRKLLNLGEAARRKRIEAGAPDFYSPAPVASTYSQVMLSKHARVVKPFRISDTGVCQYEGDPIIQLEATTAGYGLVAKMVSNLMVLAGEVAAAWCMERNIPIPYRAIQRNPEPAMDPDVFKKTNIDPRVAKYGYATRDDLLRYMKLMGQATASASPLKHFALGLPAYCKATSPLRRYTDLYAHWQIEAALRREAETGKSLIGSTDDSYLPFSRAQVEELASTALRREKKITQAKNLSIRHWVVQAFFRAFYFNQAPLPETFMVNTLNSFDRYQFGWLHSWNIRVVVNNNDVVAKEGGFRVGDMWEAKIAAVEPYYRQIIMEPIRLVEREI